MAFGEDRLDPWEQVNVDNTPRADKGLKRLAMSRRAIELCGRVCGAGVGGGVAGVNGRGGVWPRCGWGVWPVCGRGVAGVWPGCGSGHGERLAHIACFRAVAAAAVAATAVAAITIAAIAVAAITVAAVALAEIAAAAGRIDCGRRVRAGTGRRRAVP